MLLLENEDLASRFEKKKKHIIITRLILFISRHQPRTCKNKSN